MNSTFSNLESLTAYLEIHNPVLKVWFEEGPEQFILENLILNSLKITEREDYKFYFTPNGLYWLVFGYKIFREYLKDDPTRLMPQHHLIRDMRNLTFRFGLALWNAISTSDAAVLLKKYQLKELGDCYFHREWAHSVMTQTLMNFLETEDLITVNRFVIDTQNVFEEVVNNLINRKQVENNLQCKAHFQRFLMGFTPIMVLQVSEDIPFMTVEYAKKILEEEIFPEDATQFLTTFVSSGEFLNWYLETVGNGFFVLDTNKES